MPVVAKRMSALGTENAFRLGDDIRRCVERGEDPIRFNLGEPDFDSIPEINAVAIAQIAAGNSHYCDPAGLLPFRETLARHVSQSRGIDVDPAQVVVTPGGKPTIGYTFQTYVDPGDEVIYPSPGLPHLRVLGDLRRRETRPHPPFRIERLCLHPRGTRRAPDPAYEARHSQLALEPDGRSALRVRSRRDR